MVTVCVYCASSEAVASEHRAVARSLGEALVDRGWELMYGGGNIGLMGEVARAVLAGGGRVTGVIPHLLADREVALEDVTNLVRTDTMRERKALMDEGSDAFVVLPGGIGTLEELVEIITLKQLGYHNRVIVLLDPTHYWEPLLVLLRRMVAEGLATADLLDLIVSVATPEEALDAVVASQPGGEASHRGDPSLELEMGDVTMERVHLEE